MKNSLAFIRTTLIGGVLFLVPVVLVAIVIGKALQLTRPLVEPLAALIRVEMVAGVALAKVLAVAVLLVFCFAAGLFARTSLSKRLIARLEAAILSHLPGYTFMKGMGESLAGMGTEQGHEPVLVWIEEAWQIAFLVERIEGGQVAVFIPDAPRPWSGSLFFMPEDRIKPLNVPTGAALNCVRRLGVGANGLLKQKL